MIDIYRIENSTFESNSYIAWDSDSRDCVIIDCGDCEPLLKHIEASKLNLKGVLLTHGHFDHIYGLNDLLKTFPNITIYCSEGTAQLLYDKKLNYSLYHEQEYEFEGSKELIKILKDSDTLDFFDCCKIEAIATPGHDKGCLSFIIGDHIFTGDSYIPGIKTVTNLRGNKKEAVESEEKIKSHIADRQLLVCPGHGTTAYEG